MKAEAAAIVLAFALGCCVPYLWFWIDWSIGKRRKWRSWS